MRLNIMRCDRCGQEYEPYSHIDTNGALEIDEQGNHIRKFEIQWFNSVKLCKDGEEFRNIGEFKHFDLCKTCSQLLYEWLTKKEV